MDQLTVTQNMQRIGWKPKHIFQTEDAARKFIKQKMKGTKKGEFGVKLKRRALDGLYLVHFIVRTLETNKWPVLRRTAKG